MHVAGGVHCLAHQLQLCRAQSRQRTETQPSCLPHEASRTWGSLSPLAKYRNYSDYKSKNHSEENVTTKEAGRDLAPHKGTPMISDDYGIGFGTVASAES